MIVMNVQRTFIILGDVLMGNLILEGVWPIFGEDLVSFDENPENFHHFGRDFDGKFDFGRILDHFWRGFHDNPENFHHFGRNVDGKMDFGRIKILDHFWRGFG